MKRALQAAANGEYTKHKMENTDLFEKWDILPVNVLAIIEHMNEQQEKGKWDYEDCEHYRKELNKIGYTYDFGLDAEPYNLRKI